SRRRHTRLQGDWSSDVCSSDLDPTVALEAFKAGQVDFRTENTAKDWATAYDFPAVRKGLVKRDEIRHERPTGMQAFVVNLRRPRSEERRVGKECRSRWST